MTTATKKTKITRSKTPTRENYDVFDQAYAYFNKKLFQNRLPGALITPRPHRGAYGYFSSERFAASNDGSVLRDEIALNMKHFQHRSTAQTLSTLVHEMVHQEQYCFGKPSRNGYHNKAWANLMERVGLMPSDTGEPGGKRTGQRVSHYIIPSGPYDVAFKAGTFVIPFYDRQEETELTRKKRKITYICVVCDNRVTGKPDLKVHCDCGPCGMAPMLAKAPDGAVAEA